MRVTTPNDIAKLLGKKAGKRQEHFYAITLNGGNEVVKCHTVSVGTANCVPVHPRDVFYHAIKDNAVALVIAHNHPGGNPMPSREDEKVTQDLCAVGELMKIPVLDHVIVTPKGGLYSFDAHGKILRIENATSKAAECGGRKE